MWKATAAAMTALLIGCGPMAEPTVLEAGDDDAIGYDEFGAGFYQTGVFDTWDLDDDGLLAEDEWVTGFSDEFGIYDGERWGAYPDWDVDASGFLDEDEFGTGVFSAYDLDDDLGLDDDEFGLYANDWI